MRPLRYFRSASGNARLTIPPFSLTPPYVNQTIPPTLPPLCPCC
jgi:hypothetical protein